jgi:hypothetical protein
MVELGFRQGVGAFLLDRVLGREDEEGRVEFVAAAEDGDLQFLHGLEHRGLGLGRSAVDFVGQHDIGEDRAADELELAAAADTGFLDDVGAGDVGRHQVRGELDAVEGKVEGAGDG